MVVVVGRERVGVVVVVVGRERVENRVERYGRIDEEGRSPFQLTGVSWGWVGKTT